MVPLPSPVPLLLQVAKRKLRARMRAVLQEISAESVAKQTQQVVHRLLSLPEYQAARGIGVYLSMASGEIATAPIVSHALAHGKRVYVPFTYESPAATAASVSSAAAAPARPRAVMDLVSVHSWQDYQQFQRDRWGIPVPAEGSIATRASCLAELEQKVAGEGARAGAGPLDLVVVPGMAFDAGRGRLGHGKGYYDNFFRRYQENQFAQDGREKAKMPLLVALALHEQVLAEPQTIPADHLDWQMDVVIVGDGRMLQASPEDRSPAPPTHGAQSA
ncbi:MAG: hypothetical protein M1826_004522 [Phylliscum demangeonii]|nr:MAG: hypothetical protein M1826_004522 [Phylliscum demangeonii]